MTAQLKSSPQKLEAARRWHAANRERANKRRRESYRQNMVAQKATTARWREANPDKIYSLHLRRRYGIDLAEYDRLFEKQKGRCAICGSRNPGRVNTSRFAVDHDHKTKKVRGLLCQPCNLMVGKARDNPTILMAAARYLKG